MAEEKRGLLGRLFGWRSRTDEAAAPAGSDAPEDTLPPAEGQPPEALPETASQTAPGPAPDGAPAAAEAAPAAEEPAQSAPDAASAAPHDARPHDAGPGPHDAGPHDEAAAPALQDQAPPAVQHDAPPVFRPEPVAGVAPAVIAPLLEEAEESAPSAGSAPDDLQRHGAGLMPETTAEEEPPAPVAGAAEPETAPLAAPDAVAGPEPEGAALPEAGPASPADSAEAVPPAGETPPAGGGDDRRFFAEADDAPAAPPAEGPKASWLQRLRRGLSRTTQSLAGGISGLFTKRKLDVGTLQDLEDLLIQADLGVETATAIADRISDKRYAKGISDDEVRRILAEEIELRLAPVARPLLLDKGLKPHVVLVVGVNGTGKTTTIGKISAQLRAHGRSVMLAAGDTFRAAAIAQLTIWGERTGAKVIARAEGSDAASLAFDAMKEAREAGADVLLIDTAGRLQNRAELMAELEKVIRVIRKHDPSAPHDVILTLDATTGQNAMRQVEIFGKTAGVTGLVMTKLDGTARGGILVAIAARYGLPVHFIGVGEGIDDLEPFDARDFARAIAGLDD